MEAEIVLYDDADIVIRNREVAALDDSGRLNFDVMHPCTIQVCVPHHLWMLPSTWGGEAGGGGRLDFV